MRTAPEIAGGCQRERETAPPSRQTPDFNSGKLVVKTRLLFLCSRNQWRSPTAEALFAHHPRYEARSAGTVDRARIKVTAGHIGWADLIFCMEKKHGAAVTDRFAEELGDKPLIVLRIPDEFQFMDPALVELLKSELAAYLEL
jgi:predicted protein tyrosine phosphatase